MSDKEKELKKQIEELKNLLKQTLPALCDYRTMKGQCAKCNTSMFCLAKKIIPKIQQILKRKQK